MSLLQSDVFKDFPTLKIVISHGGGAIPYQIGRFRAGAWRSEEHTSELQSLMRISYAVFCLNKKNYSYREIEKDTTSLPTLPTIACADVCSKTTTNTNQMN